MFIVIVFRLDNKAFLINHQPLATLNYWQKKDTPLTGCPYLLGLSKYPGLSSDLYLFLAGTQGNAAIKVFKAQVLGQHNNDIILVIAGRYLKMIPAGNLQYF